jgi:hypothetical protein
MEHLITLYTAILPTLLQVIASVLGLLLIWATGTMKARWGIEIEARHREALQSAIMSGIRAALTKGLSGAEAVNDALSYTERSVPDAIAALAPSPGVLVDLAQAKLREAIG